MRPWIWPGGVVRVRRCSMSELRVGDIAVWFDGERMLCHRVIEHDATRFRTKPDLQLQPDEPALAHQLIGVISSFERGLFRCPLDNWPARWLGRFTGAVGPSVARTASRALRLLTLLRD